MLRSIAPIVRTVGLAALGVLFSLVIPLEGLASFDDGPSIVLRPAGSARPAPSRVRAVRARQTVKRAQGPSWRPLSFSAWKREKVYASANHFRRVRRELHVARYHRDSLKARDAEMELNQAQLSYESARDLSVRDYIALHVSPMLKIGANNQVTSQRLHAIASRLTSREVAQILESYARSLSMNGSARTAYSQGTSFFPER